VLLAMKGPKAADEVAAAAGTLRRMRRSAAVLDVGVPELPGHVIVRVTST